MDFTIEELIIIREISAYFYFGDTEVEEELKKNLKFNEALHRVYAKSRLEISKKRKKGELS